MRDAADFTFLLRHHLQLNDMFVTGLHGAERPRECAICCPLKLRLGFDQLCSLGNVIGHLHLLRGNLADVFHPQFKRREFTDLNFGRRDFFEREGRRLSTLICTP